MQSSDTYISPNTIPALKCDRGFELQQTYHKIFTSTTLSRLLPLQLEFEHFQYISLS